MVVDMELAVRTRLQVIKSRPRANDDHGLPLLMYSYVEQHRYLRQYRRLNRAQKGRKLQVKGESMGSIAPINIFILKLLRPLPPIRHHFKARVSAGQGKTSPGRLVCRGLPRPIQG